MKKKGYAFLEDNSLPYELIQFAVLMLSIGLVGIGIAGLLWFFNRVLGEDNEV